MLPSLALLTLTLPLIAATQSKDVAYVTRSDGPLTLDASVPEGEGPFPACILVHGGGFTQGDKNSFIEPIFQPLADARFTWFTINYRLAPQHPFPAAVADVEAAIEFVRAHAAAYKVNPGKIALIGESAGAYLVDYVGVHPSSPSLRVAAVVSFYGPHDLVLQAESEKTALDKTIGPFTGVHDLNAEGRKRLHDLSPYFLLHKRLPPFLLIHGDADPLVPYEQSLRFRRALQDHDGHCELITVPGGKHGMAGWDRDPAKSRYQQQMIEWLNRTLK